MINKIQQLLIKNATGKKVLLFFIITQIVYGTMLLWSIPNILKYSHGMKILDLMPTGYGAQYVQKLFETLGERGRDVYLFQQIPLDLVYPVLFAISFSLLLTYLFRKSFFKENIIQKTNILPLFAALFDYVENFGIIIMLNMYPASKVWVINTISIFSILKSVSTTFIFILLLLGLILLLMKKIKSKREVLKNESQR